ncbi:MAG: DUF4430 domain-containing protein [Thermoleophilaceae bacterium]
MRRAAALLVCAVALAGCGLGPGKKLPGGARLVVTRDFGRQQLYTASLAQIRQGETVMRMLESRRAVKTSYGGGFVDAINGLGSSSIAGRQDWFYFVNGIEASVGAAEKTLSKGDVVQWDYRRWDATMHIPAIVGAFPEPFLRGSGGKRFPVRVECAQVGGAACKTALQRLDAAGVPTSSAAIGSYAGEKTLRVVVAPWSALRGLTGTAGSLAGPPSASGVFARFSADGKTLWLEDQLGKQVQQAPPGTGLVAATAQEGGSPVWIVTGLDAAGVNAAAGALNPATLRDAFAVAVEPRGVVRLPVGGGA